MQYDIIFSGFGGQGALFAGQLLAYAAMDPGRYVTWIPSYGPEMRGGTAHCTVIVSEEEIGSPLVRHPSNVVALNNPSVEKYEPLLATDGYLFYNSSLTVKAVHAARHLRHPDPGERGRRRAREWEAAEYGHARRADRADTGTAAQSSGACAGGTPLGAPPVTAEPELASATTWCRVGVRCIGAGLIDRLTTSLISVSAFRETEDEGRKTAPAFVLRLPSSVQVVKRARTKY